MKPFRIEIRGECFPGIEVLRANAAANADRPRLVKCAQHGRKLAVVGGGPLVASDLPELRAWDGDVWGVNTTAQWLCENGVDATLFTIDGVFIPSTVQKRILATVCPPEMFVGECIAFETIEVNPESGFAGGQSSVTRVPSISMALGYLDVSFFGCEGSFEKHDHVDRHEGLDEQMIVRAGGADYLTRMDYLLYTEELAKLISAFGVMFKNRSGGLLKAMLENMTTWEVVAVSAALKKHLETVNGAQGLYDNPYVARVA